MSIRMEHSPFSMVRDLSHATIETGVSLRHQTLSHFTLLAGPYPLVSPVALWPQVVSFHRSMC